MGNFLDGLSRFIAGSYLFWTLLIADSWMSQLYEAEANSDYWGFIWPIALMLSMVNVLVNTKSKGKSND